MLPLPQTAEYAVRAVLHIAAHEGSGAVRVSDTAASLRVPQNYLSKTLHQLARAGVLASMRGPTGGFRLAQPAERLTLDRIISPFASTDEHRCLLGSGVCGETPGCVVHAQWAPIKARIREFFSATTVADLLSAPPSTSLRFLNEIA